MLEIDFLFVFIITRRQLSNLLLPRDTLFLVVECQLLILDGRVQTQHSNVTLAVIQSDFVQDLFQAGFGLNSLLFNFPQFLRFECMDVHLRLQ